MKVAILVCLFVLFAGALAGIGFDIDGGTCDGSSFTQATFNCFATNGATFAVIQAWQGGYQGTQDIALCAQQAHAAGLAVSLYLYACPQCTGNQPAYNVFQSFAQQLKSQGVQYTYGYFDIENCPPDQCWYTEASQNVEFLQDAIDGFQAGGGSAAIYASQSTWSALMGGSTAFKQYPLWYAAWNNAANCGDFVSFGGWTSPHMHQYQDTSSIGCFSNVDMDVEC